MIRKITSTNDEDSNERLFLSGCIPVQWKSPYERALDAKLLADSALMDQAAILKYKYTKQNDRSMLTYLHESYLYLSDNIRNLKEQKARQKPVQMARILNQTQMKLNELSNKTGCEERVKTLNKIVDRIYDEYPALKDRLVCRNTGICSKRKNTNNL